MSLTPIRDYGYGPKIQAEAIHRQFQHVLGPEPPYNIKALAEHCGLEVDAYPFRTSITGALVRIDDQYSIVVNRRHGRPRRRWTVAHELYHYIAHRRLLPQNQLLLCAETQEPGMQELEAAANTFAAELLMPYLWVRYNLSYTGPVPYCAEAFGVSVQAMRRRLEELRMVRPRGQSLRA